MDENPPSEIPDYPPSGILENSPTNSGNEALGSEQPRRRRWLSLATVLSGIGRTLITAGILILLFVAYQLWGTGLYTAQQQDKLKSAFEVAQERFTKTTSSTTTTTTTTTSAIADPNTTSSTSQPPLTDVAPPPEPPADGQPLAQIRVPKIDVNWTVVQGTSVADLRKGPGHYDKTPMPGQLGNAAIAGHRTTYGAPFNRMDELVPGDEIRVETLWGGNYLYRVTGLTETNGFVQDVFGAKRANLDTIGNGVFPVSPKDIDILWPYQRADAAPATPPLATLTLSTCHPEYTARQRLIVTAVLVTEESDAPVAAPTNTSQEDLATQIKETATLDEVSASNEFDGERNLAIIWGTAAAVVGLLWWFIFHKRKKWYTWILGAIPFLLVLFVCYVHIERMLPSSI